MSIETSKYCCQPILNIFRQWESHLGRISDYFRLLIPLVFGQVALTFSIFLPKIEVSSEVELWDFEDAAFAFPMLHFVPQVTCVFQNPHWWWVPGGGEHSAQPTWLHAPCTNPQHTWDQHPGNLGFKFKAFSKWSLFWVSSSISALPAPCYNMPTGWWDIAY